MSVAAMCPKVRTSGLGLTFCCLLIACHSNASLRTDPVLTPLMNAAAQNDLPKLRQLLTDGVNVSESTEDGRTALYEAIERRDLSANNLAVVDALLRAGADPNEMEFGKSNALVVSLTRDYGNPAVTIRLLQAGSKVPQDCPVGDSEDSVLALATMDSSLEVMRELIQRGSPVNCQSQGASALYWAALNGQEDRVALLLRSGANPRQEDAEGRPILAITQTTSADPGVRANFARTRSEIKKSLTSDRAESQQLNSHR